MTKITYDYQYEVIKEDHHVDYSLNVRIYKDGYLFLTLNLRPRFDTGKKIIIMVYEMYSDRVIRESEKELIDLQVVPMMTSLLHKSRWGYWICKDSKLNMNVTDEEIGEENISHLIRFKMLI